MSDFRKGFSESKQNLSDYVNEHREQLESLLKENKLNWMDLPNPLEQPGELKQVEDLVSCAYQLQAEVKQKNYPMDYNYRQEHMGEKYKHLMDGSLALFRLAIMEELDKYKDVMDVFRNNRANPTKLRKDMENLVASDFSSKMKNFVDKNRNTKDPEILSFIQSYKPPKSDSSIVEIKDDNEDTTNSNQTKPRSKEDMIKKYGSKK